MHIFLYLLGVVGIFVMNYFWNSYTAYIITVFFVVLSVVSLDIALIHRNNITIRYGKSKDRAFRNENYRVGIEIVNRSVVPAFYLKFVVFVENRKRKHSAYGAPKAVDHYYISYIGRQCGLAHFSIGKFYTYGLLHVFRFAKKVNKDIAVPILPRMPQTDAMDRVDALVGDELLEVYSATKKGDDPSEIFGIKEYVPGDSIKRIHWKLTAKSGELMVKENSLPICVNDSMLLDFLNFTGNKDALFDMMLGIGHRILTEGFGFTIYYCHLGSLVTQKINTMEQLLDCFEEIYIAIEDNAKKRVWGDVVSEFVDTENTANDRVFYFVPFKDQKSLYNMAMLSKNAKVFYITSYGNIEKYEYAKEDAECNSN